jgi:cobalamin synthase
MTAPQAKEQPRYKTWAAWCLVVLLIPLTAASCGLLYSLYLHASTGKLSTVAKGIGRTSREISFAESPVWFAVFFVLTAALAAFIVVVTVVCAKLAYRHLRPSDNA